MTEKIPERDLAVSRKCIDIILMRLAGKITQTEMEARLSDITKEAFLEP